MDTKKAFQERMNAEMRKWEAEFNQLQAKADIAKADTKLKYAEQIDALRAKQEQAQQKMQELRDAGENAWEDLKGGVQQAWHDLRSALDQAGSQFK